MLCTFANLSPDVLTYLFSMFCLSLHGGALWKISSVSIQRLEVSFNKILRRIWKLPYNAHTRIVHRTAGLNSIYNQLLGRSETLFTLSQKSSSFLIRYIFEKSATCCYTFLGFNRTVCSNFVKKYSIIDNFRSQVIRDLRLAEGFLSLQKSVIYDIIVGLAT